MAVYQAPWFPPGGRGVIGALGAPPSDRGGVPPAGHADIIREQVDGATICELMAGAEGWPETPWLRLWRAPE